MNKKLYLQVDPASVSDFLVDRNNNAYGIDREPLLCQFDNTQMKSNEGWLYCPECELMGGGN